MRTIERSGLTPAGFPLPLVFPLLALTVAFILLQTTPAHGLLIFALASVFTVALVSTPLALYLLIFSMLLSPEFVIGGASSAGPLGRGVTLRLEDLLLLVIGASWLVRTALHKELALVAATPLNGPILLYMAVCVVSTVLGMLTGRVGVAAGLLYTMKYFEYFFIYFMVVNHLRGPRQVQGYLIAALLTAAAVSLYAILQIPGGGRASAPFEGEVGEPNTLGGYLVLMLAVAGGLLVTLKEQGHKALLATLVVLMLVALSATLSRGSYLALAMMLLVLVAFSRQKVLLALTVALLVALSPYIVPERVKERVSGTFVQYHEREQVRIGRVGLDSSTSARLISWRTSLGDWLRHPLFGHGVAGYGFLDAQYFKVLVETGLAGFAAFGYLLFRLWGLLLAAYRSLSVPWMKGLALGALAGLAGLLVHAVGANSFIIVRIMEPFWLLVGLVVVLSRSQEKPVA